MKNYLVLVVALVLSACSSGGGGGEVPAAPDNKKEITIFADGADYLAIKRGEKWEQLTPAEAVKVEVEVEFFQVASVCNTGIESIVVIDKYDKLSYSGISAQCTLPEVEVVFDESEKLVDTPVRVNVIPVLPSNASNELTYSVTSQLQTSIDKGEIFVQSGLSRAEVDSLKVDFTKPSKNIYEYTDSYAHEVVYPSDAVKDSSNLNRVAYFPMGFSLSAPIYLSLLDGESFKLPDIVSSNISDNDELYINWGFGVSAGNGGRVDVYEKQSVKANSSSLVSLSSIGIPAVISAPSLSFNGSEMTVVAQDSDESSLSLKKSSTSVFFTLNSDELGRSSWVVNDYRAEKSSSTIVVPSVNDLPGFPVSTFTTLTSSGFTYNNLRFAYNFVDKADQPNLRFRNISPYLSNN